MGCLMKITDEQLKECLAQGMTQQEIAAKYGMNVRNVTIRKAFGDNPQSVR